MENAISVYVSDHGEMLGERYYRFNKYCLYESSVRVPMIISGTALPKDFKGKIDNRSTELVDVYPTILNAVGINVPEAIPGLNLLGTETRQAAFCALHERKNEASFMWRTNKYKLILMMNRKKNANQYSKDDIIGGEFYDLDEDPQEWNNLYDKDEFKSTQRKMSNELIDKLQKLSPLSPNSILWETSN